MNEHEPWAGAKPNGDVRAESGRFVGSRGHADVAVIVVTYRSAADIAPLIESLRPEAHAHRLRVIIADNDSPDDTLAVALAHDDVIAMSTGGNLGYSGGINAAMRVVGDAETILVLNPDMVVDPGAIAAMLARLAESGAGIVVPMMLDGADVCTTSLRREPTVLRSLGDAVFGGRFRRRPGRLAEMVLAPSDYTAPHRVDWATGAALLISRDAAAAVGEWDERFFLYSEETDYFRRAREAGFATWFEPAAVVRHSEGGSGESLPLFTLLAVNRIRYFAKHHGRVSTALFHGTAVLNEVMRSRDAQHRARLRVILSPRSWSSLPQASRPSAPVDAVGETEEARPS